MTMDGADIRHVRRTGDEIVLDLVVPPDVPHFRGHFPGYPVLPGVVQIDWAMRLAALHLGLEQRAARNFKVKFSSTITPNAELRLTLRLERDKRRLSFVYRTADKVASSGQVVLEAL
jgi:3-hydroxymyristoyl/3-hydroxydecanoyl-(acyl carrier protein) dehydratase